MTGTFSLPFNLVSIGAAITLTQLPARLAADIAGLLIGLALINSTYTILRKEREKVLELQKLDQKDLEAILNGVFDARSFIYAIRKFWG